MKTLKMLALAAVVAVVSLTAPAAVEPTGETNITTVTPDSGQVVVVKSYDWDIAKLAADAAPIMLGVLGVGALLKHAFPAFNNRWIPLLTWTLGTIAFVLKSQDYSVTGIFIGVVVAAAATGIHSGIKNTVESDDEPTPRPTPTNPS